MKKQAEEEIDHAKKFYEYINDRREKVEMLPIEAPKSSWSSPLEVFEDTFAHEQKVTEMINSLVDAAREANDHATFEFLQWFVKEQVEEEANAEEIVQKLRFAGDSPSVILMLDQALGSRED
jgi:ferritin